MSYRGWPEPEGAHASVPTEHERTGRAPQRPFLIFTDGELYGDYASEADRSASIAGALADVTLSDWDADGPVGPGWSPADPPRPRRNLTKRGSRMDAEQAPETGLGAQDCVTSAAASAGTGAPGPLPSVRSMFGSENYDAAIGPVRAALLRGDPVPVAEGDGRDLWISMALLDMIKEAIRDGREVVVPQPADWLPSPIAAGRWIAAVRSELEHGITTGMRP